MRLKTGVITLFCTLLAHAAVAEELPSIFGEQSVQIWPMAGSSLANGKEGRTSLEETARQKGSFGGGEKSPGRALLLSAILPGAGEFYAGSKKKAAVFFGIEAITVGLYFSWKGKGDDIEKEFRAVADAHWNPETYVAWRGRTRAQRSNSFTHAMPCSSHVEIIAQAVSFGDCSSSEVQQYYELLGKYDQFVAGWDDLKFVDSDSPVSSYNDVDSVETVHSELRMDYEKQRNDSNKYLKRASNLTGLILVNHVISAIDAARTARLRSQGADAARLERRVRFLVTMHQGSQGQVPMLMAFKPFD